MRLLSFTCVAFHSLLNTARKLYMTAEEYRLDGDEELAYITYMKYFNMLTAIHKKSDYASHKSTVRQMLGDTESNRRIMDTLEVIMNSLRHRYAQQRQPVEQIGTELVSNGRVSVEAPATPSTDYARLGLITCQVINIAQVSPVRLSMPKRSLSFDRRAVVF